MPQAKEIIENSFPEKLTTELESKGFDTKVDTLYWTSWSVGGFFGIGVSKHFVLITTEQIMYSNDDELTVTPIEDISRFTVSPVGNSDSFEYWVMEDNEKSKKHSINPIPADIALHVSEYQ